MKKDRNCGMPSYPVYPNYPGMMPMQQPGMMPMGPMTQMPSGFNMNPTYVSQSGTSNSSIEQQLSNLNSQVNSLERRIRKSCR